MPILYQKIYPVVNSVSNRSQKCSERLVRKKVLQKVLWDEQRTTEKQKNTKERI